MTTEVSPVASVTLDGSGNGQVAIGPPSGTTWRLRLANVSTTGTARQPQAFLYRGSSSGPLEQIDSTFLGNSASSGLVAGAPFFSGQVLWAKWTGGDPGAVATIQAYGQQGRQHDLPFESAVGEGFPLSVATVFQAGNTVITGSGMFVYNGAPGPGNPPVTSIVDPGVTQDPYGNTVSSIIQVGAQFGGNPFTVMDQFGNIKLFSSDGDVIIQQSPGNDAIFVYEDDFGTQGPLLVSMAGKAGSDPNTGTAYPAGLKVFEGVIEGTNAFFYSPSPAFGNLAESVTASNGTDDFGNAYIAGTATYANNGTFWSAVVIDAGVVTWYKATGPGGPWTSEAGIGFNWNSLTGGGLNFSAPAGSDMTGDLAVTGSVTVTATLAVSGTDVGTTLAAIISALSGASTSTDGLSNGTISGSSSNAGLTNGTISGTSGGASTGTAHTHGPGSFAVTNGQHNHGGGSFAVTSGLHSHTLPIV